MPDRQDILDALSRVPLPDGGDPVSRDMVRAVVVSGGQVSFILEADSLELAARMAHLREAAEHAVARLPGVEAVSVVLTAPGPVIGRHVSPRPGSMKPAGIGTIIAVGSGKGGVGKSTVATNLAVALALAGKRVGLLDGDIHGPSVPRMMGLSGRPASPDGTTIEPMHAHGVTVMSIGLMLADDQAVMWRGPMLMGALQQMLGQVAWGDLDTLVVDLPPGTGDVVMTLCQRAEVAGAVVVSTPQDVALLDVRKALAMFRTMGTPVLGLVENMACYVCPACGHEAHIFGTGGVAAEAGALGLPVLGSLPISLETRAAGDAGIPIAAGEGPMAEAYAALAGQLIADGHA